jgi:hypothetical protein
LTLAFLNRATIAWVEMEYNRRTNEETGQPPVERMLQGPGASRPAPDSAALRFAFTRYRQDQEGSFPVARSPTIR